MRIHIGKRIWKTAIAVLICFFIYMLRSEQTFPFFSTITAILCMQPYVGNIRSIAGNQLLGTLIGASYGVLVLWLFNTVFPDAGTLAVILTISLLIVPVIKTTVLLKRAEIANFVCVVFLCMALYLFEEGDPFFYVLDRVLDTIIGVVVAFVVNSADLPRRRRTDLLFVSALDDRLMTARRGLSSYSKIELNRMIADGANIAVSTEQTPASLIDFFAGIEFNLPVIAMNGAVLYDISSNKYIYKIPLERETVAEIDRILDAADVGCFYNSLIQDTLLIYFEDFKSMTMQEIYRDLRKNPYRNYVRGRLPDNIKVLYVYLVDETEKIKQIMTSVRASVIGEKVRMVTGMEEKYHGFSYLKIYNAGATRQHMIGYLRQIIDAKASITFGEEEGKYDFIIPDGDEDQVVRIIKSLYRPFLWQTSMEKKIEAIRTRLKKREKQKKAKAMRKQAK